MSHERIFQTLADRLRAANGAADLRNAIAVTAAALDFDGLAYIGFPETRATAPVGITNYASAWVEQYIGQRYDRFDPVVSRAIASELPFVWGTEATRRNLSKRQLQFFEEASEVGIARGYTVPIHATDGRRAALTLTTTESERTLLRTVERHSSLLHLIGLHFHSHANRKLRLSTSDGLKLLSHRERE